MLRNRFSETIPVFLVIGNFIRKCAQNPMEGFLQDSHIVGFRDLWYNIARYYACADSPSDQREDNFPGESCASPGGKHVRRAWYNNRKALY